MLSKSSPLLRPKWRSSSSEAASIISNLTTAAFLSLLITSGRTVDVLLGTRIGKSWWPSSSLRRYEIISFLHLRLSGSKLFTTGICSKSFPGYSYPWPTRKYLPNIFILGGWHFSKSSGEQRKIILVFYPTVCLSLILHRLDSMICYASIYLPIDSTRDSKLFSGRRLSSSFSPFFRKKFSEFNFPTNLFWRNF